MSHYCRDEILTQGLELAASPTVIQHDMPGGMVASNAWSIKWLQNALDLFHRKYPFSSDIVDVNITIRASNVDLVLSSDLVTYLPTDYIIDVKDGIDITINNQIFFLIRKSYQYWRRYYLTCQNTPSSRPYIYTKINNKIKVLPLLDNPVSGVLHYYSLPSALNPQDPVTFPDEFILIEFVRLKALEWTRAREVPIGTAQQYLVKQLAGLRVSGLLDEPEFEDAVPLNNNQIILDNVDRNSWMGPI